MPSHTQRRCPARRHGGKPSPRHWPCPASKTSNSIRPVWNSCSSHPRPMRYVLDTNVVSELRKAGAGQANAKVSAWIANVDTSALFLSAITVMELEIGIQRAERKDPRQGIVLRAWMNGRVMRTFAAQVLPTDVKIARRCAALHVPDRRSERDALIPATALVHGMIVVTRNVADFTPLGTPLLNPGHPTEAATHPMRRLGGPPDLRASQVLARRLLRVAPSARSCAFSLRTSWLRSRISATASSPASKSRSSRRASRARRRSRL